MTHCRSSLPVTSPLPSPRLSCIDSISRLGFSSMGIIEQDYAMIQHMKIVRVRIAKNIQFSARIFHSPHQNHRMNPFWQIKRQICTTRADSNNMTNKVYQNCPLYKISLWPNRYLIPGKQIILNFGSQTWDSFEALERKFPPRNCQWEGPFWGLLGFSHNKTKFPSEPPKPANLISI